ncbi:MAG: hypothetical protein O8C62_01625 [Candidatus Methanoperedens sp.]|nr:hypothetical protein [Candidatus Methanoperedens sp.]
MVSMDEIRIRDKKYSSKTLELLAGQKGADIEKIHENVLTIAEVVDDPDKLPYVIEGIKSLNIDDMDKFRFVLLRVQVDSHLHMNEDLEKYMKRLYVAQVIEKLLYGELLLEEGKEEDEDDEDD